MQSTLNGPETDTWAQVAPVLDDAMAELGEHDRAALVLRFFENKPVREIAGALKLTEDAAKKRVARALEKLRGIFAKRGVTLTGAAIAGAVSANAVQAVPLGLAAKISAAALIAGTTLTATTAIVMTTLQKTLIGTALAAAVGVGIYEARRVTEARAEAESLRQMQATLADQVQPLSQALSDATNQIAALREDNDRLSRNTAELSRLRAERTRLRNDSPTPAFSTSAQDTEQANRSNVVVWFKQRVNTTPVIDHFVACQRILRNRASPSQPLNTNLPTELPAPTYFEGRWSGTDYVLTSSVTSSLDGKATRRVAGRVGTNSYQINENSLSLASESAGTAPVNLIAAWAEGDQGTLQQIFNFGIGGMKPGSVIWEGNEFQALRGGGAAFYGRLVISNGLPWEVSLSGVRGGPPYTVCRYTYPASPMQLGGFPARTVIWTLFGRESQVQPFLELTLSEVKMREDRIPEEEFDPAHYVTADTVYTNVHSNGAVYAVGEGGRMIKMESPPARLMP